MKSNKIKYLISIYFYLLQNSKFSTFCSLYASFLSLFILDIWFFQFSCLHFLVIAQHTIQLHIDRHSRNKFNLVAPIPEAAVKFIRATLWLACDFLKPNHNFAELCPVVNVLNLPWTANHDQCLPPIIAFHFSTTATYFFFSTVNCWTSSVVITPLLVYHFPCDPIKDITGI